MLGEFPDDGKQLPGVQGRESCFKSRSVNVIV